MKHWQIEALRACQIAFYIVADVQALLFPATGGSQGGSEHPGMGFRRSDLAGDDDLLKKTQQIMPAKNAVQTAVKIGENEQAVIPRQIIQGRQDIRKHLPCLRFFVMAVQLVKQHVMQTCRQRHAQHTGKDRAHQGVPPATVIICRWVPRRMEGRRCCPPDAAKGTHQITWLHLNAMPGGELRISHPHRLCRMDQRPGGIEEQHTQRHGGRKWTKKTGADLTAAPVRKSPDHL